MSLVAITQQRSYRNLTVVFQTFPGQNYFFFQTFQGIFHLYVYQNITKLACKRCKFLCNVFFYSKYRMGLKCWVLNFRCFLSWTANKLTNASVINSVIDICIFQFSITVRKEFFPDFSIAMIIFKAFQGLGKFLQLIPELSTLFQDLYEHWCNQTSALLASTADLYSRLSCGS